MDALVRPSPTDQSVTPMNVGRTRRPSYVPLFDQRNGRGLWNRVDWQHEW